MSVNLGTAVGYLDLDTSKFKAGLKDAQSTLSEFTSSSNSAGARFEALGSSLKTVGSTITTAVSLPLLALGAGAIKTASDFEYGMSEVRAITGATGKDMEALEQQAKQLGATTKFSASDAAEGMKYFGMAGYKTDQIMSALPATLNLAAAGGTDLGIACDIVSDAMTGLGMSAEQTGKFTDIMAATITNSNTNIELMGETLKYVGPIAGTLGIEMGDLSVAIGLMGNAGIKGSQAGTALRSGLTNLVKPTDQMQAAMEKYGVELVKNSDGSVNLMRTMENLRSTLGGLDQATQAQALATIFGKEAMSGFASIVNASETDFNKLSEAIANSEGKASDMAKTMQDNLKGSIDNMKSALEGVLITIGQRLIPIFQNLVEGITNVFTWFNNLNPAIQNVIIGVGGFLAILGPLLLIVGNVIIFVTKLGLAISTLVTFFSAGGAGAAALSAAIAFITGPVGLVIAAITAFIAIGTLLYKNWDTIKAKCIEIWQNSIKPTIEKVTNTISAFLQATWTGIQAFLSTCWNLLSQLASTVWNAISSTISTAVNAISSVIKSVFNAITSFIQTVLNGWKNTIQNVWNAIQSVVSTYVNAVRSVIQSVFNAVSNIISTTSNGWKVTLQAVWEGIKSIVSTGVNAVKNVISTVWSGLKDLLTAPFIAAKGVIDGILSGISSAISSVSSAISSVKNAASSVIDKVNPFKKSIEVAYIESPIDTYSMRSNTMDMAKRLVYSDNIAKASIADSIAGVSNLVNKDLIKGNDTKRSSSNSVVINNTYNSPKSASIRELKRQDEIQMRRLAMQLGF